MFSLLHSCVVLQLGEEREKKKKSKNLEKQDTV